MEEKKIQGSDEWLDTYTLDPELKKEPGCEVEGCDEQAAWYSYHRCCRRVFIACRNHTGQALKQLRDLHVRGVIVKCGWCGNNIPAIAYMTRPFPLRLDSDLE